MLMRTRCASSAPERGGRGCWGRGEGAPGLDEGATSPGAPGPGAVSRGAPELDEGPVSPGAPESSPAPAPGSPEGSVLPQDTGVLKGSGSGSAPPVLAGWPESESESAGLSESGSGSAPPVLAGPGAGSSIYIQTAVGRSYRWIWCWEFGGRKKQFIPLDPSAFPS